MSTLQHFILDGIFHSERLESKSALEKLKFHPDLRGMRRALVRRMETNVSFSRILCAVDFSKPARAAFQHALVLAKAHGAELHVVFVVPRSVTFNWRMHERIRLMADLRSDAVAENVSLSVSEQQGDPAEIILLHAKARMHGAIVIGTHGRSGLERLRFGSVAERVVARAPCPTFVVRSTGGERIESAFSHILCSVNVSPASESAVKGALKLLKHGGRKLTLLHVVPLERVRAARMQLQQLALAGAGLGKSIHARLAGGPVASGILDVAAELKPDLIVLGVTSRRGMRRWFHSITGRIVRQSTCPVLAIPIERP